MSASASTTVPFSLGTASGATLHGAVDLPDRHPGERPTVVICHGFKGFLDWGFFPHLGSLLADRGYVAVRFNLSGTGMKPGDELVSDPGAFRANTHGREVEDLLSILEATGEAIAPGRVDRRRIGLFGHSRGGGNAVLAASRSPWGKRVKALVTWASVAGFDRYSPEQKEAWRRDGELPVVNARTRQRLTLGLDLLEEIERRNDLDVLAAASRVRAPWLIVHGEDDESVAVDESERLAAAAGGPWDILRIPGANHTFGSRHPFVGPTPQLIQALNATQRWYRIHL
jgi:dipeptidyl aminopeptidase/acylaminoacyl peptidase